MFMRVYVKRATTVLSSGKWNKQTTSHYISPQWLDETHQDLTAPPLRAYVSRVPGLNVQTQMGSMREMPLQCRQARVDLVFVDWRWFVVSSPVLFFDERVGV